MDARSIRRIRGRFHAEGWWAVLFRPADKARPATVLEKCGIGKRISIASGADMSVVGTAVHDCIALSFANWAIPLTLAEVETILTAYEVSDYVSPAAVLHQVQSFRAWLESRWPGAKFNAEIAVQSLLESGQVLNGRIDLLLELDESWILIDHKSSHESGSHRPHFDAPS